MSSKGKIVVLAGPTAVGKTGASLALAREFGGEIISADAVAVYRGMDIGTAKPSPEEQGMAPHHMIDVVDPDQPFDANLFATMGGAIADSLIQRGKPVFVAGGTGLYIKALVHGLFAEGSSDPALRARLREEAQQKGSAAMHQRLATLDPASAQRIHPNDAYRILRALEVCILTGEPASAQQGAHGFSPSRYDVLFLCLNRERDSLYQRIDMRVDQMMAQGLKEEVQALLARGYGPELKSMQSIGYRHMHLHLAGRMDYEETVTLLKRDTRRLAKRQLTWFRAYREAVWAEPHEVDRLRSAAARHLE